MAARGEFFGNLLERFPIISVRDQKVVMPAKAGIQQAGAVMNRKGLLDPSLRWGDEAWVSQAGRALLWRQGNPPRCGVRAVGFAFGSTHPTRSLWKPAYAGLASITAQLRATPMTGVSLPGCGGGGPKERRVRGPERRITLR